MSQTPVNDAATSPDETDYLWDQSKPADPLVAELEQSLGTLKYDGAAPPRVQVQSRSRWRAYLALAALIAIGCTAAMIVVARNAPPAWDVTVTQGAPTIDNVTVAAGSQLRVDQWLDTAHDSIAQLSVADIGALTLEPDTQLRLIESKPGGTHRIELAHGAINAEILAPPRLFLVDTPSAQAVDLGCTYRLAVNEAGDGLLEVTWGWVALESGDSSSSVPAGAACRLRAGRGPGVPWFTDAAPYMLSAAASFDRDETDDRALREIIRNARKRDVLTLHHLLDRTTGKGREAVVERMLSYVALPEGVSREDVLASDAESIRTWWLELSARW